MTVVDVFTIGVITQEISCELGVSKAKEALLGIIMYIAMAVSTFVALPISTYFGKRLVILASLYISIAGMCSKSTVNIRFIGGNGLCTVNRMTR